ncbi:MAG: hypothetical protein IKK39_09025, partial [Thermoguttaceae bacterium]|nr:hypothetical protein [Thermoguttaceae bacterium]
PGIPRTNVATNSRFKNGKRFAANVRIAEIGCLSGWGGTRERRAVGRRSREAPNVELGKKPAEPSAPRFVRFEKIKGHSGRPENERCDELAVQEWKKIRGER